MTLLIIDNPLCPLARHGLELPFSEALHSSGIPRGARFWWNHEAEDSEHKRGGGCFFRDCRRRLLLQKSAGTAIKMIWRAMGGIWGKLGGWIFLECMCAKSLQSCLTLCDPLDCSLLGSSVHGDFPGKNVGVGCHALLWGIFLIQGSNPCLLWLLHCWWILYHWATGEALITPVMTLFLYVFFLYWMPRKQGL